MHGLNPTGKPIRDHARGTWQHSSSGFFWPTTFAEQLASEGEGGAVRARIMLFEYNSDVYGDPSNASLLDHANNLLDRVSEERRNEDQRHRNLIFVAHSLG